MGAHKSVVVLEGGLGNQLFQYAFGLNAMQGEAILDNRRRATWGEPLATALKPGAWRPPTQVELLRARQCPRVRRGQRTLLRLWGRAFERQRERHVLRESAARERLMPGTGRGVTFYEGYFQHESYLLRVRDALLSGLAPELLQPHPGVDQDGNHVAVSLRLGHDYRVFGLVLPDEYYRRALSILLKGIPRPVLHLCTDDVPEAHRLLQRIDLDCGTVEHADDGPLAQLRVLATARRIAIANSSFSWWGAWLGDVLQDDARRRVLCPDVWLAGPESITPARWIRVPTGVGETE